MNYSLKSDVFTLSSVTKYCVNGNVTSEIEVMRHQPHLFARNRTYAHMFCRSHSCVLCSLIDSRAHTAMLA